MRKKLLFSFIAIVVLAFASYPMIQMASDIVRNFKEENIILLTMSGFEPNVLYLDAGVETEVLLVNVEPVSMEDKTHGGDEQHQRGLHQYASDELGFDYKLKPQEEMLITIKVDEPGEYEVYCDVCCGGRNNEFMRTKIIVN